MRSLLFWLIAIVVLTGCLKQDSAQVVDPAASQLSGAQSQAQGGSQKLATQPEKRPPKNGLHQNSPVAIPAPQAGLVMRDADAVELQRTEELLDLNQDFTIEISVRWPKEFAHHQQHLAGDWQQTDRLRGWALRTVQHDSGKQHTGFHIEFMVAGQKDWIKQVSDPLPLDDKWTHIAVCRQGDSLNVYCQGAPVGQSMISEELVSSRSPISLGPIRHAHAARCFDGEMGWFHVSSTARYSQKFAPASALRETARHWFCSR